jgi:hypothetical protein
MQEQGMAVDVWVWRDVLCEAITTHVDEMSCEECYAKVDRLAELVLQGKDTVSLMPGVHDHLAHCQECREEFQALLSALRGTAQLAPPAA